MQAGKGQRITGWILSGLVALMLIGSGITKLVEWEGKEQAFQEMGYTVDVMTKIGIVEILVAVIYLIPPTSFLGAILVTAYFGGATATHARIEDPMFLVPITVCIVAWIGLALRHPSIFGLAAGKFPDVESRGHE